MKDDSETNRLAIRSLAIELSNEELAAVTGGGPRDHCQPNVNSHTDGNHDGTIDDCDI
jgi:bacteriocin-like protein